MQGLCDKYKDSSAQDILEIIKGDKYDPWNVVYNLQRRTGGDIPLRLVFDGIPEDKQQMMRARFDFHTGGQGTIYPKIKFNMRQTKAEEYLRYLCTKLTDTIQAKVLFSVLFEAEMAHLNKYGRPITGDTYTMINGVPTPTFMGAGIDPDAEVRPSRTFKRELFSKSDLECLDAAFERASELSKFDYPDGPISFEQMIHNPEALEYLYDVEPFCMVI
jgi:hypothetical protein